MWCLSDKQLSQASRLDQPAGVASDHGWDRCVAASSRVTERWTHSEWHKQLSPHDCAVYMCIFQRLRNIVINANSG